MARHRCFRAAVQLLRHEDLPRRGGVVGERARALRVHRARAPRWASPTRRSPRWPCCRWRMLPIEMAGWINAAGQHRRAGGGPRRAAAPDRRPAAAGRSGSPWPSRPPLAAALEPVRETLGYGQVNLLLFALIMADLVGLRWRSRRGTHGATPTARCCGALQRGLGRHRHRPGHRRQADPGAVHRLPADHPAVAGARSPPSAPPSASPWPASRSSARSRGPTSAACSGRPSGSAPPT